MSQFNIVQEKNKLNDVMDYDAIVDLFNWSDEQLPELFAKADVIRQENVGEEVHLRAIIEFSNYCVSHCLYCGLRCENRKLVRYRLSTGQIYQAVQKAVDLKFKTIILQSGEDPNYRATDIARMIEWIKSRHDIAITLSVGERAREEYRLWREAGADRYLLKHETADEILYQRLKPGRSFLDRIRCLWDLKDLGYQVGSGNMVGLPGQSIESLARDVFLMRELDIEMAGIGPFLPHPDTPLANDPAGSLPLTLKTLAITRLCLPTVHLPATTALTTMAIDARRQALQLGANVVMVNLTPLTVRDKYCIYPQKAEIIEEPEISLNKLKILFNDLRRPISGDYGHGLKKANRPSIEKKEVMI